MDVVPTSEAVASRCFTSALAEAFKKQEALVVDSHMHDDKQVLLADNQDIEVVCPEGLETQPVLKIPGIVVRAGSKVTLRGLTLEAAPIKSGVLRPLIDALGECWVTLEDCRLLGSGIRLRAKSSVILLRTSIEDSQGTAAVDGEEFQKLSMKECTITGSQQHGVRVGSKCGVFSMEDCRIAESAIYGVLATGNKDESWEVKRCTFSNNTQNGIWVDTDARILWGPNSFSGNMRDKGGNGALHGYTPGLHFKVGDECKVWIEAHAAWLPGVVSEHQSADKVHVLVRQPPSSKESVMPLGTRLSCKTRIPDGKILAVLDVHRVQQPKSGCYDPAPWSAKAKPTAKEAQAQAKVAAREKRERDLALRRFTGVHRKRSTWKGVGSLVDLRRPVTMYRRK
mmetsp:Transcript_78837/g.149911  ORF Transcript_78837/g.149911 Transcript_78837/m.149911 type:complete len:396 (-) Transcript_78837:8-1195(-)